jgi:hypothetical protein
VPPEPLTLRKWFGLFFIVHPDASQLQISSYEIGQFVYALPLELHFSARESATFSLRGNKQLKHSNIQVCLHVCVGVL